MPRKRKQNKKEEKKEVEEEGNPTIRRIKTVHIHQIWKPIMEIEILALKLNIDSNMRTKYMELLKKDTLDEIAKFYENFCFDSMKCPNFYSTWTLLEELDLTYNKENFFTPVGVESDPNINIDNLKIDKSCLNIPAGFKDTTTEIQKLKETKNVFDKLRNAHVNEDYKKIIIQLRETFTKEINKLIKETNIRKTRGTQLQKKNQS